VAAGEALERNLFHRTDAQAVREPGVVDDPAASDVDAVMRVLIGEYVAG